MKKLRGAMILMAALSCMGAMSSAWGFSQLANAQALSSTARTADQATSSSSAAMVLNAAALAFIFI